MWSPRKGWLTSTKPATWGNDARLSRHLQVIECRYPRAWEQIDQLRRLHLAAGLWPAWCHLPLARVRDLVCPADAADDPTRLVDAAIVAGLAAWRVSRNLCTSDQTAPLLGPALDVNVPPDRLQQLLDRPAYFELPPGSIGASATGASRGILAYLTFDERTRGTELRLLIEPTRRWTLGSVPLVPLALPLTEPTLVRCLDVVLREHIRIHERLARCAVVGELAVQLHPVLRLGLGLAVHLLDPTRVPLADADPADRDLHAPALAQRFA